MNGKDIAFMSEKKKGGIVSREVYDRQLSQLDSLGKSLELTPKQIQAMKENYINDHQVKVVYPSSAEVQLTEHFDGKYATLVASVREAVTKLNDVLAKDKVKLVQRGSVSEANPKGLLGFVRCTFKFPVTLPGTKKKA